MLLWIDDASTDRQTDTNACMACACAPETDSNLDSVRDSFATSKSVCMVLEREDVVVR